MAEQYVESEWGQKFRIQDVVDNLNTAYNADKIAMAELMTKHFVPCNEAFADHPSIICRDRKGGGSEVGPLGIINGIVEPIFGAKIAAMFSDFENEFVGFCALPVATCGDTREA